MNQNCTETIGRLAWRLKQVSSPGSLGVGVRWRFGSAHALEEIIEDLRAGCGACLVEMRAGFHPIEKEDEWNPAARCLISLGGTFLQQGEKPPWQLNTLYLSGTGIEAMLRCGGYEVFPAGEGADGVDGTGSVFKEGTGNAQVKVVKG